MKKADPHEVEMVYVELIYVEDGRRALNEDAVDRLAASMSSIGLRTPITIRREDMFDTPVLVAGAHRLAAAIKLGWEQIPCFVLEKEPDEQARLWEISENLRRAELTALERSELISEWIGLKDKLFQVETVSKGGRGNEGGVRAAAREIGVAQTEAHRADKIAHLSEDAKEAAREVGLDDNQSALLAAARVQDPAAQAKVVRDIADEKSSQSSKIDREIKAQTSKMLAESLAEKYDASQWDWLYSALQKAGAKNVATDFINVTAVLAPSS